MPADGLESTPKISSNVSSYTASPIVFRQRSLENPVVPFASLSLAAESFSKQL